MRRLPTVLSSCVTIIFLTLPAMHAQRPTVILGVLEDLPGHYAGESDFRGVRVVFQKSGSEWRAFPTKCEDQKSLIYLTNSYPGEVNWTIAFDGRNLGRVTSHAPADFAWYSEIGVEKITSNGPIPTIGKQSAEYSLWGGTPVYRPLVAVSKPNFNDPDSWKRVELADNQIDAVRQKFRAKFPKVGNCKNPEENIERPWKYSDEDIRVISAYSSKSGWSLVQVGLTGNRCDGWDDNGPFNGQWYLVRPSGETEFLSANMSLVDAGDYDNDGKSEVLFAIGGYNTGGYRLYYSDFNKSVSFVFHYT